MFIIFDLNEQKKYITCKKFNREDGELLNPENKGELFYGGSPICHGDEFKSENGIEVYDAINMIFVPNLRLPKRLVMELLEFLSEKCLYK